VPPVKALTIPPEPQRRPQQVATVPAAEPFTTPAKVTAPSSQPKQPTRSNSTTLILVLRRRSNPVRSDLLFSREGITLRQ